MGIELDVLVGHPEHDLLFVATQIVKAAGLKNPASAINEYRRLKIHTETPGCALGTLIRESNISLPLDVLGRAMRMTSTMFDESHAYQILMRGRSPQSEPFRKWVTEEVLPTIRKTGSYNAEESANPIAIGLMDELKALRGAFLCEI
ncbi:BRO family protein [Pseudomonas sp. Sample_16]|uniref:BRO-N domain-containing protein n=1 Tax=Pseudomonas sp. Sample_16 TaxID=2448263 RepID=UPI001032B56D|nr:BRO family protein [Pseudomonas sp. Sample_16]